MAGVGGDLEGREGHVRGAGAASRQTRPAAREQREPDPGTRQTHPGGPLTARRYFDLVLGKNSTLLRGVGVVFHRTPPLRLKRNSSRGEGVLGLNFEAVPNSWIVVTVHRSFMNSD